MALTKQVSRRSLLLSPTNAEVSTASTLAPYYFWEATGVVNLPLETQIDAGRHTNAEFIINAVSISAAVAGLSTYRIKVISYDLNGLNPITHVNTTAVLATSQERQVLTVADAIMPQNRNITVTLQEEIVSGAASDITVSMISENFSSILPVRSGHIIQNQAGSTLPQQDNLRFGIGLAVSDQGSYTLVTARGPSVVIPLQDVDWSLANVHKKSISSSEVFTFSNSNDGDVIIVKISNTSVSTITADFDPAVDWGISLVVNSINAGKYNMYTFVNVDGVISAACVDNLG